MIYERRSPAQGLEKLVNCYWLIDSEENKDIDRQKIVPDGYPEVILHFGDHYKINLGDGWELQKKGLVAGQIKRHFYLENTGKSHMLGIKFQPTALAHLFDINMSEITDNVIGLSGSLNEMIGPILQMNRNTPVDELFGELDHLFTQVIERVPIEEKAVDKAVWEIIRQKGNIDIQELCESVNSSERQLERQFKTYVGLSPKFYSRIIRLGHIFELMQQGDQSWSDLVYHSGFYDQSHFIKNFKEFTGEDPSTYGFEEKNMANFHLRK